MADTNTSNINSNQKGSQMAPKAGKAKEPKDAIAAAAKVVNRAITALFRVGNIKDLPQDKVEKAKTALQEQLDGAIVKLKNPKAAKKEGFSF